MAEDRPQDPAVDARTSSNGENDRDDVSRHPQAPRKEAKEAQESEPDQDAASSPAPLNDASHYEETHVHAVYESIADHFSATRYAPWPLVAQFLAGQPAGAIGLDVGCGNGKYLSGASGAPLPPSSTTDTPSQYPQLFVLGSDRSEALARLAYAKHAHHQVGADVLVADSLALPFRDQCADFIICIAVVHHLSTRARRQAAVEELLRCVRRPVSKEEKKEKEEASNNESGRDMKLQLLQEAEQPQPNAAASSLQSPLAPTAATTGTPAPSSSLPAPPSSSSSSADSSSSSLLSGRVLLYVWALEQASSRRGWAAGGEQDLLVPWVKTMKDKSKADKDKAQDNGKDKKKHKNKKRQESAPKEARGAQEAQQTQETPKQAPEPTQAKQPHVPPTFHRYYHLYKQGELEDDVAAAGGRVVASGYEKDNWWVVADPL
ncbi:tRNA methyltransferase, has a role in tRNA modification [Sporothrix bragantina]|uniref:tRNA methyltransferase, has a role in tRNA modification n=1 Tax=Sporothrix bragantina TaxID=671064 RepID=A0ABP0BD44_9PEZI